jgi:hypothetical protein
MVVTALILTVCGIMIAQWFRVFVLIPASFALWCLAAVFAWVQSFSVPQGVAIGFLFVSSLQFGYLAGAIGADFIRYASQGSQRYKRFLRSPST